MSNVHKIIAAGVLAIGIAAIASWAGHVTFFAGTTDLPNFVAKAKAGRITGSDVISIEVVQPPVGHNPFTPEEYKRLNRQRIIVDKPTIERIILILKTSIQGRTHQNHPIRLSHAYLKINCTNGFYWVNAELHDDGRVTAWYINSNTRNATNWNGGTAYHIAGVPKDEAWLLNPSIPN